MLTEYYFGDAVRFGTAANVTATSGVAQSRKPSDNSLSWKNFADSELQCTFYWREMRARIRAMVVRLGVAGSCLGHFGGRAMLGAETGP